MQQVDPWHLPGVWLIPSPPLSIIVLTYRKQDQYSKPELITNFFKNQSLKITSWSQNNHGRQELY